MLNVSDCSSGRGYDPLSLTSYSRGPCNPAAPSMQNHLAHSANGASTGEYRNQNLCTIGRGCLETLQSVPHNAVSDIPSR